MSAAKNRIILYYKNFISAGGAERLFIKEHDYFLNMGYDVYVITNNFSKYKMFGKTIKFKKHINLNASGFFSILKLAKEIRNLDNPLVLCSSGDLNIYLASLLTNFKYALHIHHPAFMSFNDYDKFSILAKKNFSKYVKSNYGASRFKQMREEMPFNKLIYINLRAIISFLAKKKSVANFVLSKYAKKEKKDIYGIDSVVFKGAIEKLNFKKKYHTQKKYFNILTVARLDKNKRIDTLIKSFSVIYKKYKKIKLIIVGSGPEEENLKKLALELKIIENIEFHGHLSDSQIVKQYRRANLFISIDWADYKITLFESLNHCLPIIVSNETEVEKKFLKMGVVKSISPSIESLSNEIELEINSPTIFNVIKVKKILKEYTWESYFCKLNSYLIKQKLIISPIINA